MNNQISKSRGPGVYIPPPLFYVLIFIAALKRQNKLIDAQPIVREGVVLKKTDGGWTEKDIVTENETGFVYQAKK
jgi:hypothetical protein